MDRREGLDRSARRDFLRLLTTGAFGLALPGGGFVTARSPGRKPLRGIFPIAQTPFTADNKLDLDALAAEVKFIDRGGVHGFVWPQLASEWTSLTEPERFAGAEAILSTGKDLRPAIVIGVQSAETAAAVRFAKHAEKLGADAIIALPPTEKVDPKTALEYYKEIGGAAGLPLFVQAVGSMDVGLILDIYKSVPTMRYVKDEAGDPLQHVGPLREASSDQLKVFSGSHGRTLIEEMRRGFSGSMPAASFADLYAATWELWQAGKHKEAMDMHARTLLILTEATIHGPETWKYILHLRGVFPAYGVRNGMNQKGTLDEGGKQALRETLDYLKPFLRS